MADIVAVACFVPTTENGKKLCTGSVLFFFLVPDTCIKLRKSSNDISFQRPFSRDLSENEGQ